MLVALFVVALCVDLRSSCFQTLGKQRMHCKKNDHFMAIVSKWSLWERHFASKPVLRRFICLSIHGIIIVGIRVLNTAVKIHRRCSGGMLTILTCKRIVIVHFMCTDDLFLFSCSP